MILCGIVVDERILVGKIRKRFRIDSKKFRKTAMKSKLTHNPQKSLVLPIKQDEK